MNGIISSSSLNSQLLIIILVSITLYLFFRTLHTGSFLSSIIAGVSLGGLCQSFVYVYLVQFIVMFSIVMVILHKYSVRLLTAYSGVIIPALMISTLIPVFSPLTPLNFLETIFPLIILIFFIIISFFSKNTTNKNRRALSPEILTTLEEIIRESGC